MNEHAVQRVRRHLQRQRLEAALFSNPATVTWLTGYAPPIQAGPSPFEAGPALCWVTPDSLQLLASNLESGAAGASGAPVSEYVGYTIDEPLANAAHMAAGLAAMLGAPSRLRGRVGVELDGLSAPLLTAFSAGLPKAALVALDGAFEADRAVKSPEELAKIRAAVRVCDAAQAYARRHARAGQSEIALWGALKADLEIGLGTRLPVLVDLVGGKRTAEIGGLPGPYVLQEGDPLILDFVPRVDGYWGDNTETHSIGERPPKLAAIYTIVHEALRRGIDAVRPGVRANELDGRLRQAIRQSGYEIYPHHSGHGLGASYHEEPRLVPYNSLSLEAGMVIAIEPGIYVPGVGGVRLEHVVVVTPDGCDLLTTHLDP
jgi:Xaa-Pro aminopeptidase